METTLIEDALKQGNIKRELFQGSNNKDLITELQRVLFELGFRKELKWDNFNADGDYGNATKTAIAAFASKNKHASDGSNVTDDLAELILQRHDFLPSMYLLWQIHNSDLRTKKFISKGTPVSITAIQLLLNELGYGAQLNFTALGADGDFGPGTRAAMIAYARDRGIQSDGDWLSRPLINQLIKDIDAFYGSGWKALAENHLPGGNSPLVIYQGSRFRGKPCQADVEFLPMLKKINTFATQANVHIFVTSAFRTSTNVQGAIVTPAKKSNHLAGHAIDMNVMHGNGQLANSSILRQYPNVPEPVRLFIKAVIDDPKLRWGQSFNDPVHIDDHLNKDLSKWEKRYQAMQQAVQLGG